MNYQKLDCTGYCDCGARIYGIHLDCDACRRLAKQERDAVRQAYMEDHDDASEA